MGHVSVLIEHTGSKVDPCSLMTVRHAVRLALDQKQQVTAVSLFKTEDDTDALVEALAREGVDKVIKVRNPDALAQSETIEEFLRVTELHEADIVLAPATLRCSMMAARIAKNRAIPVIADCISVQRDGAGYRFEVATAGGMALVEARTWAGQAVAIMPLREGDCGAAPGRKDPPVTYVELSPASDNPNVKLVERMKVKKEDMTLAEAAIIVSGGRGLGGSEGFELLAALAQLIGGHVGASRVATDMGWIDRNHLVGMSGSTVRPALYLAIGISGAPHHLMGMRDATTIVALNTDENAPIMKLAHHAFVGDVNEVVPKVISILGC